jgi:hypothetical protein
MGSLQITLIERIAEHGHLFLDAIEQVAQRG